MLPTARPAVPPLPVLERLALALRRAPDPSAGGSTAAGAAGKASQPRKPLVLVVDDEADLVELITLNLERNGFEVIGAGDGNVALSHVRKYKPDLVVLDLMLPGVDGTEVARRLRADPATAALPIVMLTAKSEETDVIVGLSLGADDYVTKPFSPKVLVARVQAILRRSQAKPTPAGEPDAAGVLRAGPLAMDLEKHEISVDGRAVRLTLTEFKLLRALVEAGGRVLSRDRLMDKGMGTDVFVTDRAIDVHITAIRKKLGDANWLVHTVRGVGYRLQDEPPAPGE